LRGVRLERPVKPCDEELVVRWSENIVWQFFSGMAYYEHRLPCDATQIGRFRRDLKQIRRLESLADCWDRIGDSILLSKK